MPRTLKLSLLSILSFCLFSAAASPADGEDIVSLTARVRAAFAQSPKLDDVLEREDMDRLDLILFLLRFVAAKPASERARRSPVMAQRNLALIERAAKAAAVGGVDAFEGEFVRRQIMEQCFLLLKRYRTAGQPQDLLHQVLENVATWRPEDLPRLVHLVGKDTSFTSDFARSALMMIEDHPERAAEMTKDLVRTIRRAKTVSDEQRALLVMTGAATDQDVFHLVWSMANAYARALNPNVLAMFDEEDILHRALNRLMESYGRTDKTTFDGFNRAWRAHQTEVTAPNRPLRNQFLHRFTDGRLFGEPERAAVRVNEAPRPARASAHRHTEENVLFVDFGCQKDLEPKT